MGKHGAIGAHVTHVCFNWVTESIIFVTGDLMVYKEDGASLIRCRSARYSDGIFMVNKVRGRPFRRVRDHAGIAAWCKQHLIRVDGHCFVASRAYTMCMLCFLAMASASSSALASSFAGTLGFSLHSTCVPGKPLHWASDERCDKWRALGFLREHLGEYTRSNLSGSVSVWSSLLNYTQVGNDNTATQLGQVSVP